MGKLQSLSAQVFLYRSLLTDVSIKCQQENLREREREREGELGEGERIQMFARVLSSFILVSG